VRIWQRLIVVLPLWWGLGALAVEPRAKLVYVLEKGAERCPPEAELRSAVAARLGYEPFSNDADRTVHATVKRRGRGLRARIVLQGADGTQQGERTLDDQRTDCSELASAMALALSIAIDPLSLSRPAPVETPPPPPPPAPPPPPEPVAAPAPAPPPELEPEVEEEDSGSHVAFESFLGASVSYGGTPLPVPSVGMNLSAGPRWERFSLNLEGYIELPSRSEQGGGTVIASRMGGALVPCLHVQAVGLCGVLNVAALLAEGQGFLVNRQTVNAYVGAGARVILTLPEGQRFGLRIWAELLGNINRTSLTLLSQQSQEPVARYDLPVAAGGGGLAILLRFD
jgi:hypothetical protein